MEKILHIFRSEKFTESFVNLMKEISDVKHTFWIFGENYLNDQRRYLKSENVKYYPRMEIHINKKSTEKKMQSYDLIIYHGVFENYLIKYFYIHKKLLKKMVLYFWGGDKEGVLENRRERKEKRYIIKNALKIATIIPQDYDDLKKTYHLRGEKFCAWYYDEHAIEVVKKMISKPKPNKEIINIQVGNSATKTNNHLEIIKILGKFKEKNIKVYVPLSYGDPNYANEVIEYGKEIFGDKFVPLQKYVPKDQYYEFLYRMDVAIFDMKRQQALGNILTLMQMGCKIYLNRYSLLWDFFNENLKCKVADTNEIYKMDIETFVEFSEKNKICNRDQAFKSLNKDEIIKGWKNIFGLY